MTPLQLTFWAFAAVFMGLAVAKLLSNLMWARRSKALYDRVMWDQTAEIAAQTQQMKRIAFALEHIAGQFPENKAPYFERLLMTLQEWTPARR
jgi:hypothetical protein